MNILCWWFGCKPDIENAAFYNDEYIYGFYASCKRCHEIDVTYSDLAGDTRHNRFKTWFVYWLFSKWIPTKCPECGHRYKHDHDIDHIPF